MLRFGIPALFLSLAVWHFWPSHPPRITIRTDRASLPADGASVAHVTVCSDDGNAAPDLTIRSGKYSARIEQTRFEAPCTRVLVRSGVMPGTATLAALKAERAQEIVLTVTPVDGLALDLDADDETRFRRWFTYLAEAQYFRQTIDLPVEINDCAALIRFAYREALRSHDGGWAEGLGLRPAPSYPAVRKYEYPHTPLGANLFAIGEGKYGEFADSKTLRARNTHLISRDLSRAKPGDILFFVQDGHRMPFHTMIYLGAGQIDRSAGPYVLYHTGPEGKQAGEIRRLTVEELRRFPQPEWRPEQSNQAFLGVYRWNILRTGAY